MPADDTYRKNNYDQVSFWAPKGKRAEYNGAAASLGLSLAQLMQRAVEEYINNHRVEMSAENAENQSGDTDTANTPKRALYAVTEAQNAALNAFNTLTPREREEIIIPLIRAAFNPKSASLIVGKENPAEDA